MRFYLCFSTFLGAAGAESTGFGEGERTVSGVPGGRRDGGLQYCQSTNSRLANIRMANTRLAIPRKPDETRQQPLASQPGGPKGPADICMMYTI